ncbi:MAG: tetratricopeptide repeat protein [Opitutales bacterium]
MKTRLLHILLLATGSAIAGTPFQDGVEAYHESEYDASTKAFQEAVKDNETGAARHNLALAYYRIQRPGEAVWQLERALLLEPTSEQYRYKLGALRQQLGLVSERAAWHTLAGKLLSPQAWVILLTISFWLSVGSVLLPRVAGARANLSIQSARLLSGLGLIISLIAIILTWDQSKAGIVIAETPVDLCAAPASAAPRSGLARPGERGSIVDQFKDYVEIETEGGARGWIHAERFRALQ